MMRGNGPKSLFRRRQAQEGHAGTARLIGNMARTRFPLESRGFTWYNEDRKSGKWAISALTKVAVRRVRSTHRDGPSENFNPPSPDVHLGGSDTSPHRNCPVFADPYGVSWRLPSRAGLHRETSAQ